MSALYSLKLIILCAAILHYVVYGVNLKHRQTTRSIFSPCL